jgi:hypothetical protein
MTMQSTMNRRQVRFAPSTAAGSSSKIGEAREGESLCMSRVYWRRFAAAVLVFQLYATLKQPSASVLGNRNAIGTPLVGVPGWLNCTGKGCVRAIQISMLPPACCSPCILQNLQLGSRFITFTGFQNSVRTFGMKLFGSSSPKLLVRTCLGLCVVRPHDRLGQLPGIYTWQIKLVSVIDALA